MQRVCRRVTAMHDHLSSVLKIVYVTVRRMIATGEHLAVKETRYPGQTSFDHRRMKYAKAA